MEAMIRDWVNWCWLSGDHIVEQHVHNIDVINWFTGSYPVKAVGFGSRMRRVTGDQYDFFSVEYIYENGVRAHCAARQINGCSNGKVERIVGTKGVAIASGRILDLDGNEVWKYPTPEEGDTQSKWSVTNPFVQEHINLVTGIRTGPEDTTKRSGKY